MNDTASTSSLTSATSKRTLLVTGGAGFIGSWFIRYILENEPQTSIINLDLLTYAGNLDNLSSIEGHPRYEFIHGDITDKVLVRSLMKRVDICVNIAAQTHVDRSIDGPDVFISTNVVGTQTLLEAARLADIQKFIQVSTDEVYGSLGTTGAFTETSPLDPSSPYSASKASADLLVMSYFKTYGLAVCITRCSNNYGSYQYPEKLIPRFVLNAMAGKPLPVYGDGLNVRDWIHVRDHNQALALVMNQGHPGEIYNIGANNEQSNLSITKRILQTLDKPESLITFVEDRLGHDRRYAIDSSKIQGQLGWQPSVDFDQGLEETILWYGKNPEWVRRLEQRLARDTQAFATETV